MSIHRRFTGFYFLHHQGDDKHGAVLHVTSTLLTAVLQLIGTPPRHATPRHANALSRGFKSVPQRCERVVGRQMAQQFARAQLREFWGQRM